MCMCICVWGKRRIKLCQNSDLKENKQSGNLEPRLIFDEIKKVLKSFYEMQVLTK